MLKVNPKVLGAVSVLLIIFISIGFISAQSKDKEVSNSSELSGEITFVSNRTDKRAEINELIEEFEEEYPKVKVKLELIGDAEEILERKASVGELSDVTLVPSGINISKYNQFFLPIDDLGFNTSNMYNYNSGLGSDNKLYAITTSLSWLGVIYNKRIFEECGIKNIPNTVDEFLQVCEKIKNNNITPISLNYKQPWTMNIWFDSIPYLYDSKIENKLFNNKVNILDDGVGMCKSLDFAKCIYDSGYCESNLLDYDWSQCKNDIVNKHMAMIIWNSDFIYQLQDMGMDKDDIGMFPIPDTSNIKVDGDYKIAISKYTKHPDESKAFLKFLFENDRYANAVNIMSNLKESSKSKEFIKGLECFNIPIQFQNNIITNQSDETKKLHEKYTEFKNKIGINYKFVQRYITCEDTQEIKKEINEEWMEFKNSNGY